MCNGCGSCGYSSMAGSSYMSDSNSGSASYTPSSSMGYAASTPSVNYEMSSSYNSSQGLYQ